MGVCYGLIDLDRAEYIGLGKSWSQAYDDEPDDAPTSPLPADVDAWVARAWRHAATVDAGWRAEVVATISEWLTGTRWPARLKIGDDTGNDFDGVHRTGDLCPEWPLHRMTEECEECETTPCRRLRETT